MTAPILHATTVACWLHGGWRGVLLRGGSGAGKSSLALRCAQEGWRLVADDRTLLWSSGGRLYGRAPARLAGLLEARGLGVLPMAHLDIAEIGLVVDLVDEPGAVERMPDAAATSVGAGLLPVLQLWPHDSAAVAKLRLALASPATPLGLPQVQAYQAPRADTAGEGPDVVRGPPKRNR